MVISPNELNSKAATLIMAPCTTAAKPYASRLACTVQGRTSYVMLDQIRTFSYLRLVSRIDQFSPAELNLVLDRLQEMFAA